MSVPARLSSSVLLRAALRAAALVVAFAAVLAPRAAAQSGDPAPLEPGGATWVSIEGALDWGVLSQLRRAVDGASARGDALVIELDTPGGEVLLMKRIGMLLAEAADERGVPTVAWVNTEALSAGALVALACETIYFHPKGRMGAATPITVDPMGAPREIPEGELREKLYSDMRATFREYAEARGRPGVLAEAMVDRSIEVLEASADGVRQLYSRTDYDDALDRGEALEFLSTVVSRDELLVLTGPEAVALGMADGPASDESELLTKLSASSGAVTRVERTRSEEVATWLHTLSFWLFVAGLVLGFLELKTPGFGWPGILAATCFGVMLFGQYLVGLADIAHVLLVMVGIGLITVEIFVAPGTLWFGGVGVICTLAGLLLAGVGTGWNLGDPLDRRFVLDGVWRFVFALGLALAGMLALSRVLPNTPLFNRMILEPPAGGVHAAALTEAPGARAVPGTLGRALTDLRPVGKVALDSGGAPDYEATASGAALEAGARVRVVEVRGGRLVVEAVEA